MQSEPTPLHEIQPQLSKDRNARKLFDVFLQARFGEDAGQEGEESAQEDDDPEVDPATALALEDDHQDELVDDLEETCSTRNMIAHVLLDGI